MGGGGCCFRGLFIHAVASEHVVFPQRGRRESYGMGDERWSDGDGNEGGGEEKRDGEESRDNAS